MKAAPFAYHRVRTIDEAVSLKAELGDEAKILAGGQSLVPSMNFRLAQPEALIDIGRLDGEAAAATVNGRLSIGPLVRHSWFESDPVGGPTGALLSAASKHIGHAVIRRRGTFLGSLAHADPASEWCVTALATDLEVVARSQRGDRLVPATELFAATYTTTLTDDEILVEARLPLADTSTRAAFVEFSRRAGDFALVCVAVSGQVRDFAVRNLRVAVGGVAATPARVSVAEDLLEGQEPSLAAFDHAAREASRELDVIGDIHGSAEYRRQLVHVYVRRALQQAYEMELVLDALN